MVDKKTCCQDDENYPNHEQELSRLNRLSGQISGIKNMIETRRYCPDILIQLKAVRSAIKSVESNILKRHLEFCVSQSFSNEEERNIKIEEMKTLLDRFQS